MLNVTKTYLPPLDEYTRLLKKIWKGGWVTNDGVFLRQLEERLKKYLGVNNLLVIANGTLATQIALKALEIRGEVITTPFSYVASTSSLVWEGCQPRFADINPQTLCLDPDEIEKKVTPKTQAILAVHIFGNICEVEKIAKIAQRHNLKVIYDAAHAFGINYQGKSILDWGDASILSFHATKIFHTVEGGAIVAKDKNLIAKCAYMRNFGHHGYEAFAGLGINAKASELHAAMGLILLKKVQTLIQKRQRAAEYYDRLFEGVPIVKPVAHPRQTLNYTYYPVILKNEKQLLGLKSALEKKGIFPRRYFYPPLTRLPYIKNQSCPIAEDIASRILCLPLAHDLSKAQVQKIVNVFKQK